MKHGSRSLNLLRNGTSALAIAAMVVMGVGLVMTVVLPTPAVAQDGNGGGGNGNGGGGGNGNGGGGQGGAGGGHGDVDLADDDDGEDGPDGRGPRYGQPDPDAEKGGAPVWAGEDNVVDDVTLGRLNVARAPAHVLVQAYGEAVKKLPLDFYDNTWTEVLRLFREEWDTLAIVDSPLENLALLKDAADGSLTAFDSLTLSDIELMAIFLGVASDKNLEITGGTAEALFQIFSRDIVVPSAYLTEAFYDDLGDLADQVREAVLAGHG